MQAEALRGRTAVVAGDASLMRDQIRQCLTALGADVVELQSGDALAPTPVELTAEQDVSAALERVLPVCNAADIVVFAAADVAAGDDPVPYLEQTLASCHFTLKLALRLRATAAVDVLAVAQVAPAVGTDESRLTVAMRNGALRQMTTVAASEGGPQSPALVANTLYLAGEIPQVASTGLMSVFEHLFARPQGYLTGTSTTVRL